MPKRMRMDSFTEHIINEFLFEIGYIKSVVKHVELELFGILLLYIQYLTF